MYRWLKNSILTIVTIVLAIAIIILLCIIFMSPDRLTPVAIEKIKEVTGREVKIDGKLSWTFFPNFGVKTGHLTLSNPNGFASPYFIEVNKAIIAVKVMPLLHKQIESNGVVLSGVTINLIKDKTGKTNWQFPANSSKSSTTTLGALSLIVSHINLNKVNINWLDERTNQSFHVTDLAFQANNITLNKPFPIQAQFNFSSTVPSIFGNMMLKGKLSLADNDYQFLDGQLTTKIRTADNTISLTSKITADFTHQWVNFRELMIANNDVQAKGHAKISNFSQPKMVGQFTIGYWHFNQLKISDVQIEAQYQQGLLRLHPITASLYQGKLQADTSINFNKSVPQIALEANLQHVNVEPLLQDLSSSEKKIKIKGEANINFDVTTQGNSKEAILSHLNGTGNLQVRNGIISGVDVGYWVDTAEAIVSKQTTQATDTKQTSFGSLAASVTIKNGIISNNNLTLDAPRIQTKGVGTIDLPNQRIDYDLRAMVKQQDQTRQKNDLWHVYGLTIPIHISGNLMDPSIQLDTQNIIKQVAHREVQHIKENVAAKVQEKVQDQLKKQANNLLQNFLK